jgi:hypothetical protein
VRPTTAPTSLTLPQSNFVISSLGAIERVYVVGNYAGAVQRDLTSSAAGTTFTSSNTKVITVDSEGNATAAGFGTAVVTVDNSGVQAFATFTVEDPAHPLAAQDLSAQLTVTRFGFRVDRNTGLFDQNVEITDALSIPVVGPLYLVVPNLPSAINMVNSGSTQNITPVGSPYIKLALPDGIVLQPGTTITRTLQFLNPSRLRITYAPKIFRTPRRAIPIGEEKFHEECLVAPACTVSSFARHNRCRSASG